MISVKFGEYRFFSGDNVMYEDSSYDYLFEQAATAKTPEMRRYAAAGIMRGLLDLPVEKHGGQEFFDAIRWSTGVILDVLKNGTPQEPTSSVQTFVDSLNPVNGVFDATSIAATNTALRDNNPKVTKAAIEKHSPRERRKLVIALGHGGITSSLATVAEMPEDTLFYPVRFSIHKEKDKFPVLSEAERELLCESTKDRDVIVHDEDRGIVMQTMPAAVLYFGLKLGTEVFGVTPATGRHPGGYEPQVIWYKNGREQQDTFGVWSKKLDELRAGVEQTIA